MRTKNRVAKRLVVLIMTLLCCHLHSFSETTQGKENGLEWSFNSETKQLTIEGSGALNDVVALEHQSKALKLVIGEGVTSIGNGAFVNCDNLLEIVLPSTIAKIDDNVFKRSNVGTIRCYSDNPPEISQNSFNTDLALCIVFVPEGSRKLYAKAAYWKDFEGIYQGTQIPDDITGSCGENATFKLQPGEWQLYIQGKGEFGNEGIPWEKYSQYIYKVHIDEGITNICNNLCANMTRVSEIDIPLSVVKIGARAFYGCKISSFSLPKELKSIGKDAFFSCPITSLSFPDGLEIIENGAFSSTSLKEVNLPQSLQVIGDNAFAYTSIKSLAIPDGCLTIGSSAFCHCTELESVSLPKNLITIPPSLFSDCSHLISVEIPSSVTTIGASAFYSTSLISIKIPASVKRIGTSAFSVCKYLEECTLSPGLEQIGNSAFSFCERLESITLPNTIKEIESGAFQYCGLKTITIPNEIESVGENVFSGCPNLTSPIYNSSTFYYLPKEGYTEFVIPQGITKINATSFNGCKTLEKVQMPVDIKEIGNYAFYDCRSLKTINLLQIESIGAFAFGKTGLPSLVVPSSVRTIGGYAFDGCADLNGIVDLSNTRISVLNDAVFSGCSKLDVVILPSTLTSIGNSCFQGCEELESVNIPTAVTRIGNSAFQKCESLETISLPEQIAILGYNAFNGCINLRELDFNTQVSAISEGLFENCEKLRKISFYEPLRKIDLYAFRNCNKLDSIYFYTEDSPEITNYREYYLYRWSDLNDWDKLPFGKCVIAIPVGAYTNWGDGGSAYSWGDLDFNYGAFYENLSGLCGVNGDNMKWSLDTRSGKLLIEGKGSMASYPGYTAAPWQKRHLAISSIEVKEGVNAISAYAFYDLPYVKEIKLAETITEMGEGALSCGRDRLKAIQLPPGLKSISKGLLEGCEGLTSIVLPDSVTEIGDLAFEGCSALKEINIPRSVRIIGSNIWGGCPLEKVYSHLPKPCAAGQVYSSQYIGRDLKNCKFYCHVGSTSAYKTADGWKDFDGEYIEKYLDVFVTSNDKGTVTGEGEYEVGDLMTLTATPNENCMFIGWSDGHQDNPYVFTANSDVLLEAIFSNKTYKLIYMIDDEVYKETMYEYGATITPEPQPEGDYLTFEWIDLPKTMPTHDVVVHASYTTGITEVLMAALRNVRIYSPNGKKRDKIQKGLNIVVLDDGTVHKVIK